MSGGKRYKFAGSQIAMTVSFDASSPSGVITGISKAFPAVVTQANHGYSSGDVIKITDVVGMTDVNDEVYIIERVDSSHYELIGVDSTGYNTYVSGGHADEAVFSNFCELTNYSSPGQAKAEIPATSLCSTSQEFEVGLQDFGTTQIDFNFAPLTAIQTAMRDFNQSGDKMAVKVTLPKSGGVITRVGFVTQMSMQAGNDTLWTGSLTIRNTGDEDVRASA